MRFDLTGFATYVCGECWQRGVALSFFPIRSVNRLEGVSHVIRARQTLAFRIGRSTPRDNERRADTDSRPPHTFSDSGLVQFQIGCREGFGPPAKFDLPLEHRQSESR